MINKPKIVDLFCGCGGFGLGAELAGFHSLVAVDIDHDLQSAYKRNFPSTRIITSDISGMNEDTWKLILNNEIIDGVIGGPPCQGYSRMGHSDKNDPRRTLLHHFFRSVNIIKPKFFVMENVEGLMDENNVYELNNALEGLDSSYTVLEPLIVDASNYGAPTRRKRVIVIGYLKDHISSLDVSDVIPTSPIRNTVKDAIFDLNEPVPQSKDKNDYGWNSYRISKNLSQYAKLMRALPPEGLGESLFINKMKDKIVSGNFDTIHSDAVKARFNSLLPGQVDKISKAKKLEWGGLSPTLRAGTGSDRGSHQAIRPIHPKVGRVITVREAARMQGFPDWFGFHSTKWHSFRMIGNSVSPLVAKFILDKIKNKIITSEEFVKIG